MTSAAPVRLLPAVLGWALGPGRRQALTLRPLLGEQREALLSTACPPAPTAGSFSGLSSGCAGTWGRRGQGPAKGPTGSAQERVWQRCGPSGGARTPGRWLKPGYTSNQAALQLVLSGPHRAGPFGAAWARGFPPFPWGHFVSAQEGHGGGCSRILPCKDGWFLSRGARLQPRSPSGSRLWSWDVQYLQPP